MVDSRRGFKTRMVADNWHNKRILLKFTRFSCTCHNAHVLHKQILGPFLNYLVILAYHVFGGVFIQEIEVGFLLELSWGTCWGMVSDGEVI